MRHVKNNYEWACPQESPSGSLLLDTCWWRSSNKAVEWIDWGSRHLCSKLRCDPGPGWSTAASSRVHTPLQCGSGPGDRFHTPPDVPSVWFPVDMEASLPYSFGLEQRTAWGAVGLSWLLTCCSYLWLLLSQFFGGVRVWRLVVIVLIRKNHTVLNKLHVKQDSGASWLIFYLIPGLLNLELLTFGLDNSVLWGVLVCVVGCLAAPLAC